MNNSSSGGYLTPTSSDGFPSGLSLTQFIQTFIVGVSGFDGTLVRPKWQVEPLKNPLGNVDWIAFAVAINNPDAYAYVWIDQDENTNLQRQDRLEIQMSFYGPNAQENSSIILDGFQIPQNLEALRMVNMGYLGITPAIRGPDLVNEKWIDRYETSLILTRQVQRVYPILSFASVAGVIHTVIDSAEVNINFEAGG